MCIGVRIAAWVGVRIAKCIAGYVLSAVIAWYAACYIKLVASSNALLALPRSTSDDDTQQVMVVLDEGSGR